MKKNSNKNQSTTVVSFYYEIRKNGEVIEQPKIDIEVTRNEIQEVASIIERNGGQPVDMCELQNLSDRIYDTLFIDELTDKFPDEENFDDYEIILDKKVPDELIRKADELVKFKNVDQTFYLLVNGEEKRNSFSLQIPNNAFRKMKEIAMNPTDGKTDFESLKEREPEVYAEVTDLIFEWAYKCSIREYDEPKECILKEFPYQVYESIQG